MVSLQSVVVAMCPQGGFVFCCTSLYRKIRLCCLTLDHSASKQQPLTVSHLMVLPLPAAWMHAVSLSLSQLAQPRNQIRWLLIEYAMSADPFSVERVGHAGLIEILSPIVFWIKQLWTFLDSQLR